MPVVPLVMMATLVSGLPAIWREGPAQVPDAVNVFFGADDVSGAIQQGVLLCRIDIVGDRGWDTFGAVDIAATFGVGKGAPIYVRGPEDRSSAVVSVPAIDLAPGQVLKLLVEDRDVTERELIARGQATYAGKLPLRMDLADVQVECRAVDRATAEARAKPLLAKVGKAMAAVDRAVPDLTTPALGAPESARWEVTSHIDGAAAWLGDDDAAVRAAAERLEAALAAFTERARARVREAPRALPAPGAPFDISLLGVSARVLPGPSLVVEVAAPAGAPIENLRDDEVAAAFMLLDVNAALIERPVHAVRGRASEAGGVSLAPGATRKIRLRPTHAGPLPELARVDGVLVRLR